MLEWRLLATDTSTTYGRLEVGDKELFGLGPHPKEFVHAHWFSTVTAFARPAISMISSSRASVESVPARHHVIRHGGGHGDVLRVLSFISCVSALEAGCHTETYPPTVPSAAGKSQPVTSRSAPLRLTQQLEATHEMLPTQERSGLVPESRAASGPSASATR